MIEQHPKMRTPKAWLDANDDDMPVHFFAPAALSAKLAEFQTGFPGETMFAVKSNPGAEVLRRLWRGGLDGFDVASLREIELIAALCPGAPMQYNNPVRSRVEISGAVAAGVRSFSVDDGYELEKLLTLVPQGTEISVRFKCPVPGGAYKFDEKFGATPAVAARLLARVANAGCVPSLTFHVGTQCISADPWAIYLREVALISATAKVVPRRVNVGGGFPSRRGGAPIDLGSFFDTIRREAALWPFRCDLLCEPGRALVADAFEVAATVKSVRDGAVYLNDGIYGSLSELPILGSTDVTVLSRRQGPVTPTVVYGPTCDSLDRLRDPLNLPPLEEGDTLVFHGMGAYVAGVDTRFNGYGERRTVEVDCLTPREVPVPLSE